MVWLYSTRINAFVPTDTILEIASGYGRWTVFLKDLCSRLMIVDLTKKCIDRCRQRFADSSHISYLVNDGKSLEMVADSSVDFVFSFDSLVHAEDEVLKTYAAEIANKLRPNGVAFLNHSNLGEYIRRIKLQSGLSQLPKLSGVLKHIRGYDNLTSQMRAQSMTAAKMASFAEDHNIWCVSQELITWDSAFALIDCISVVVPRGSKWVRENRILKERRVYGRGQERLRFVAPISPRTFAILSISRRAACNGKVRMLNQAGGRS
jgi:SAM-dependent methyltransferase